MPMPACLSPFLYATGFLLLTPQRIAPRRHKDQQDLLSSNHFRLIQVVRGHLDMQLAGHGRIGLDNGQCVLIPPHAVGEITLAKGFFRHALFDLTAAPRKLNRSGWPAEASMQIQPPAIEALGHALPLCLDAKGNRSAQVAFNRWSGLTRNDSQQGLERLAVLCFFLAGLLPETVANDAETLMELARRLPPNERSVKTLAAAAGCSVRSLERRVLKTGRGTPHMLLNRLRAHEMMEQIALGRSMREIAQRLAYPSTAAVAAAFRRLQGMSVRAWRASQRQNSKK